MRDSRLAKPAPGQTRRSTKTREGITMTERNILGELLEGVAATKSHREANSPYAATRSSLHPFLRWTRS